MTDNNTPPLNKAAWDAMSAFVGERLRAAEALRTVFQALVSSGNKKALEAIQAEIARNLQ